MTYTLNQELLIHSLAKEKVKTLQMLLYDNKFELSARQYDHMSGELRQYQELLYQNRLNRQIEVR
ncbi:hypothetical protein BZK37_01700 [Enterococcus casseliflavus]|nr:hypothetical protein BZK37_01700 [Enterococcus casseliflavus]